MKNDQYSVRSSKRKKNTAEKYNIYLISMNACTILTKAKSTFFGLGKDSALSLRILGIIVKLLITHLVPALSKWGSLTYM